MPSRTRCFRRPAPASGPALLHLVLSEAFANAAECLAAAFVDGDIGSYFLQGGAFYALDFDDRGTVLRSAGELGFEKTARVLLGAFLYSNFLHRRLQGGPLERVRELAGVAAGGEQAATVAALGAIAFHLNEQFRVSTAPLYLLKQGFGPDLAALLDFDPLEELGEARELRSLARFLAADLDRELSWS